MMLQLMATESGKDETFAQAYLENLKKKKRYLEDMYEGVS